MYNLLKGMEFHLITGFGRSLTSYNNTNDNRTGQGVLQGSSSACLIFILNLDVSLSAYHNYATGASFTNPINGQTVTDIAVQFIDDTSQFLNVGGITNNIQNISHDDLIHVASQNAQRWADYLWISGGYLNLDKCFYYTFQPSINYKTNEVVCEPFTTSKKCTIVNPATNSLSRLQNLPPSEARCTLGAIIDPTGNGTPQISHTISKAKDFFGKFINTSVSQTTKWAAVTTVIEPALLYPLMNILFSEHQIKPLFPVITDEMYRTTIKQTLPTSWASWTSQLRRYWNSISFSKNHI
jgi:hypothetical protein